jgi:16S rRNA (uracil1498-N3)-methyltransferase
MHRVFVEHQLEASRPGDTLIIDGDEAVHALRVKRVAAGESVQVLDGRGVIVDCTVTGNPASSGGSKKRDVSLTLSVARILRVDPPTPRLHVFTATPKGSHVDAMIDQLSQIGAAEWCPLETQRGVVDPRDAKLSRLERIAREASKQSGRAWTMTLGSKRSLEQVLATESDVVVADASGQPYSKPTTSKPIALVVGPEGGFTAAELEMARTAGARICRFGPHVMRIETAAVAAAAIIMNS